MKKFFPNLFSAVSSLFIVVLIFSILILSVMHVIVYLDAHFSTKELLRRNQADKEYSRRYKLEKELQECYEKLLKE